MLATFALAAVLQNAPVLAITGNDIWEVCTLSSGQGSACRSYVAGVLDTYATFETLLESENYCIPERATYDQVSDVVVAFLRDNPGQRHHPGALLVLMAARDGFDCELQAGNIFEEAPRVPLSKDRVIIVPGPPR